MNPSCRQFVGLSETISQLSLFFFRYTDEVHTSRANISCISISGVPLLYNTRQHNLAYLIESLTPYIWQRLPRFNSLFLSV